MRMNLAVEGLKPFLTRISALPKTAQNEIRQAAQGIADDEVERIVSAGKASDKQSAAAAAFIKSRKDRVPAIAAGGAKKTGVSGGAKAGELFFGAEFGGGSNKKFERELTETVYTTSTGKTRTRRTYSAAKLVGSKKSTNQFRPHLGQTGYWFWPQLRADRDRMMSRWEAVVNAIAREWERND